MKEIGGYFGLDDLVHHEYYSDLIAVNSARSALLYIVQSRAIRKLYIPFFLCDCIAKLCKREEISYEQYRIGRDFLPLLDRNLDNDECIYIVNYYGQINDEVVRRLQCFYGNIILDNVQAFFQKPQEGVDTVYSCRKFFGVPDGGYVSTDARIAKQLSLDISMDRMSHILGRYEGSSANVYYEDFKKNDNSMENAELRAMSKLTHNILGAIDYEHVREKRESNFTYLHERLASLNSLCISAPTGPFVYPFYYEKGMQVKERLSKRKIYVPTLWPNVLKLSCVPEKEYAENILPLPCDQRYGQTEMEQLVNELYIAMRM